MTKTKVNVQYFEHGSLDWLKARKENITGTEMAALFGLDKYKSAAKVLTDKLENVKEFEDNIYMRAGRFLEPAVLSELKRLGVPAKPVSEDYVAFIKHPKYPISVSLDGKALWGNSFYIIEAKTCSGIDRESGLDKIDVWKERVPVNYYMQVQTQLLCSSVSQGIIACAEAVMPFKLIAWEIVEDVKLHKYIIEEVERFYKCFKDNIKYKANPEYKKYVIESYPCFTKLIIE